MGRPRRCCRQVWPEQWHLCSRFPLTYSKRAFKNNARSRMARCRMQTLWIVCERCVDLRDGSSFSVHINWTTSGLIRKPIPTRFFFFMLSSFSLAPHVIFDRLQVLRNEGITAFWRGLPTYYVRIAPHVMITLLVSDQLTRLLAQHGM
jgi:hypothetical protein